MHLRNGSHDEGVLFQELILAKSTCVPGHLHGDVACIRIGAFESEIGLFDALQRQQRENRETNRQKTDGNSMIHRRNEKRMGLSYLASMQRRMHRERTSQRQWGYVNTRKKGDNNERRDRRNTQRYTQRESHRDTEKYRERDREEINAGWRERNSSANEHTTNTEKRAQTHERKQNKLKERRE